MTRHAQIPSTTTKAVVASWAALCATGMWQLSEHASTTGAHGRVMTRMTSDVATALHWSFDQNLLVLAAHPQCPCLAASLDALKTVLAEQPTIAARILIFEPSQKPPQWDQEARDRLSKAWPDGTIITDHGGELATKLGATTSGHISLFQANGGLSFAGGITGSRGHRGDNQYLRALQQAMWSPTNEPARTPVHGCPLQSPCDCLP